MLEKALHNNKLLRSLITALRKNILIPVMLLFFMLPANSQTSTWRQLDDGMEHREFVLEQKSIAGDSKVRVLRIDPAKYSLELLCAGEFYTEGKTVEEWCDEYGLIAAVNAGMYMMDYKTNVGYMKDFSYINNPKISKYQSVVAFNPVNPQDAPFYIFDKDEYKIENVIRKYNTVIQNLRLIKRPGHNRWSQSARKWSELMLGQDSKGNILIIYSRSPYSMHDLNNNLLTLPIDLVCSQHLEGGPEASLFLATAKDTLRFVGSYETGFIENDENSDYWAIPNIIGVRKRKDPVE